MSTDKFLQDAVKAGFHKEIKITPFILPAETRTELPTGGVAGQLRGRKSIMVQNTSSGTCWVGSESVGYGASFGGIDSTQCSGIRVEGGTVFTMDAGRVRFYAFNPGPDAIDIKLLEVA